MLKLRLRVQLRDSEPYECTVPWEIQLGRLGGISQSRRVPVRVDPEQPKQVHPPAAV
jgi:hypothetical protein